MEDQEPTITTYTGYTGFTGKTPHTHIISFPDGTEFQISFQRSVGDIPRIKIRCNEETSINFEGKSFIITKK